MTSHRAWHGYESIATDDKRSTVRREHFPEAHTSIPTTTDDQGAQA